MEAEPLFLGECFAPVPARAGIVAAVRWFFEIRASCQARCLTASGASRARGTNLLPGPVVRSFLFLKPPPVCYSVSSSTILSCLFPFNLSSPSPIHHPLPLPPWMLYARPIVCSDLRNPFSPLGPQPQECPGILGANPGGMSISEQNAFWVVLVLFAIGVYVASIRVSLPIPFAFFWIFWSCCCRFRTSKEICFNGVSHRSPDGFPSWSIHSSESSTIRWGTKLWVVDLNVNSVSGSKEQGESSNVYSGVPSMDYGAES